MDKILTHWTTNVMSAAMTLVPLGVFFYKNSFNFGWWQRKMKPSDLPNMPSYELIKLVENELCTIQEKRKYPFERAMFNILVSDTIESETLGTFIGANNVLFRYSTRLALDDIESIRKNYPNFMLLFKENFSTKWVKDFECLSQNLSTAKNLGDLFWIFREKKLSDFKVDSSTLSDDDLRKVLLGPNAKKFVIAKEILYADSLRSLTSGFVILLIFSLGTLLVIQIRPKIGSWPALIISLSLCVLLSIFADKAQTIKNTLETDQEAAKLDDEHFAGYMEYLESSIELCKLLHRLTDGSADFDEDGNYLINPALYTIRLDLAKKLEKARKKAAKKQKQ